MNLESRSPAPESPAFLVVLAAAASVIAALAAIWLLREVRPGPPGAQGWIALVLASTAGALATSILFRVRTRRRIRRMAAEAAASAEAIEKWRREAKESTRLALEYALDAVITMDLDGSITGWNREAERMFGWSAEEVMGKALHDTIMPAEYRKPHLDGMQRFRETGEGPILNRRVEVRGRRRDGQEFPIELSVTPLHREGTVLFSAFLRDITERADAREHHERLLASEREARATAERVARMKDEFLSTISHELRTPLQAILGWSRLLSAPEATVDQFRHGLTVIERNAKVQAQLVEDLLDTSRMMSGKVRLDVQRVHPPAAVEAAVESVRPAAESRGIRLHVILDPGAGPILGDPQRLQQILWNLLSNAIKFTPKGGKVEVALARVESHIEISVSDTGEGIHPDFLPHVFERFRQEDASTTRRHSGVGLGLAIVRHLVELHGGQVTAKSMGEGKGATFTVVLPMSATRESDRDRVHPVTPTTVPFTADATVLTGVRILVVDDDPDSCEVIRSVLERCGADVTTAFSVADALDRFARIPPAIVVSDIGMPERDGYDLVRAIRALPAERGGTVPAVALTAFARSEDRTNALRAGYQAHVAKPVEPAELVATVASLIALAGRAPRE